MKLHVLGICGTFMGGLAVLARQLGHEVSGSDENVYPPMSTQLADQGIELHEGYHPEHIEADCDTVVIGNALSRGNPAVESVLDQRRPYASGAGWIGEQVLAGRRVIAVAGTHGKTTTASLAAWILDQAGLDPGFLIGGVPGNFGISARLGSGEWFVIEADEYDTAFFDKRSKFVHYRPQVAILNNLEFDHADIFPDLAAIQTQFHHLVRTVPGNGALVVNAADEALAKVLERGCWTPQVRFGLEGEGDWSGRIEDPEEGTIAVRDPEGVWRTGAWSLAGRHNLSNAVAAVAAAAAAGVPAESALAALTTFRGVRRRLELLAERDGTRVYDDFAHHPTAIAETLDAIARRRPGHRLVVALEPRSNSMRMGRHAAALVPALAAAAQVYFLATEELDWDAAETLSGLGERLHLVASPDALLAGLDDGVRPGDSVVFMSNGGFGGLPARFARRVAGSEP